MGLPLCGSQLIYPLRTVVFSLWRESHLLGCLSFFSRARDWVVLHCFVVNQLASWAQEERAEGSESTFLELLWKPLGPRKKKKKHLVLCSFLVIFCFVFLFLLDMKMYQFSRGNDSFLVFCLLCFLPPPLPSFLLSFFFFKGILYLSNRIAAYIILNSHVKWAVSACYLPSWGGSPGQVWLTESCCRSLMVQETASPLPLGWGSGPLAVLPGSPLGLVPGTWRALSEHLLNERRGGRVSSVLVSGQNSGPRNKTAVLDPIRLPGFLSEGILG